MRSAARGIAARVASTPIGPLLQTAPARALRRRLAVPSTEGDVARVLAALNSAGVSAWLVGGWGVDALIGRQTRDHLDIDIAVDAEATEAAISALTALEYTRVDDDLTPGVWMPARTHLRDSSGRSIELLSLGPADRLGFPDGWLDHGSLGGAPVPCASALLQLRFHQGYRPRAEDRRDVERLAVLAQVAPPAGYTAATRQPGLVTVAIRRRWRQAKRRLGLPRPAESALMLPIEAVPHALAGVAGYVDPVGETGVPAHVTLLYPFLPIDRIDPACERSLAEVLASTEPFAFTLSRVGSFPNVLYLAPEPAWPFVELTQRLWERWPDRPPYGGDFDAVVPHVTIGQHGTGLDVAAVEARLPIEAQATEAILLVEGPGRWVERARFRLGR